MVERAVDSSPLVVVQVVEPASPTVSSPILIDSADVDIDSPSPVTVELTPVVAVEPTAMVLRQSTRETHLPTKFNDYFLYNVSHIENIPHTPSVLIYSSMVLGNTPYLLEPYIFDEVFSSGHQAFLAAILVGIEPKIYKEAMQDRVWCDAMTKEVDAMEINKTWSIIDLPDGKEALGNQWVSKIKYNSDGSSEPYKVRLVVVENHQVEGKILMRHLLQWSKCLPIVIC